MQQSRRQSSRLGGPSVYQGGGAKFEIKHKNRCPQKSKLSWGAKHVDWGGLAFLGAGPEIKEIINLGYFQIIVNRKANSRRETAKGASAL